MKTFMSHLILLLVLRSIDIADEKFLNLSTGHNLCYDEMCRLQPQVRGNDIVLKSPNHFFVYPALASAGTKQHDEYGISEISY